jgi:hypothetical protein
MEKINLSFRKFLPELLSGNGKKQYTTDSEIRWDREKRGHI